MRDKQAPIVALDEIRNAKDLCPRSMGGCKILEINASTILKVGPMVRMGEAEALCLVRKRTSVPVPRVLNAYAIDDVGFLVMEKVPGITLEQCWEGLSGDARRSIVRQLEGFIQEWRQTQGPLFGSVDGGPCEDVLFKHSWDAKFRQYTDLFPQEKNSTKGWWRLSATPDPAEDSLREMSHWRRKFLHRVARTRERCSHMVICTKAILW